jgi:hypothetical protein
LLFLLLLLLLLLSMVKGEGGRVVASTVYTVLSC